MKHSVFVSFLFASTPIKMMIKIAIVLCAVMATTMVRANDIEEQALADRKCITFLLFGF